MEDHVYNVYDKPWRESGGPFQFIYCLVARAVDKEISMEMMLEGSSKPVGFIYFISTYISSAVI